MAKDNGPDSVTHDTHDMLPLLPAPTVYSTTVHDGDDTYTGYGYTRESANDKAGEKYSSGEKDK